MTMTDVEISQKRGQTIFGLEYQYLDEAGQAQWAPVSQLQLVLDWRVARAVPTFRPTLTPTATPVLLPTVCIDNPNNCDTCEEMYIDPNTGEVKTRQFRCNCAKICVTITPTS